MARMQNNNRKTKRFDFCINFYYEHQSAKECSYFHRIRIKINKISFTHVNNFLIQWNSHFCAGLEGIEHSHMILSSRSIDLDLGFTISLLNRQVTETHTSKISPRVLQYPSSTAFFIAFLSCTFKNWQHSYFKFIWKNHSLPYIDNSAGCFLTNSSNLEVILLVLDKI